MPVNFEEYTPEDGSIDLSEDTNAGKILKFLIENTGLGYTPTELHRETGIPKGSISPTLQRLERVGLVQHKGSYWSAAEDHRLAAASASVLGVESAAESYAGDWYDNNPNWADDLPDLSEEQSE